MKKWMCFLLAGVLFLSLTACRNEDEAAGTQPQTEATQPTAPQEAISVFAPGNAKVTKKADKTTFTRPIVIPHDEGSITVNPPIFTGIPVESLWNLNGYRFQNGTATVTVMTNAGVRNLEVNKAGQIVSNTDYRNPVRKDTMEVEPADIGAEYYAGEGMYAYADKGWYGIMDATGKKLTDAVYYGKLAITFYDGYAVAGKSDGVYVVIDTTGKEYGSYAEDERYPQFAGGRSNGAGTVVVSNGYLDFLYDLDGHKINFVAYDSIGYFYEGIAPAKSQQDGCDLLGFINPEGVPEVPLVIPMDTVVFNGNEDAEYDVVFFHENACLLPIGGELAVITVDRERGDTPLNRAAEAFEAFLDNKLGVKKEDGSQMTMWDYHAIGGEGVVSSAYQDINGDGIPELFLEADVIHIVSYSDAEKGLFHRYTSQCWEGIYLLEDGGILDICEDNRYYCKHGDVRYRYLTFGASGIEQDISFSAPASDAENPQWYFQGEAVSKEQWEKLTKPYLSQSRREPNWY